MKKLSKLHLDLLKECADDDVGLWFAIAPIEDAIGEDYPLKVRTLTLEIVEDLLHDELIMAGFPIYNAEGVLVFDTWNLSVKDTIARINKEWDELGREPTLGEIVWFVATEKGIEEVNKTA
jgi:hypothetical protein